MKKKLRCLGLLACGLYGLQAPPAMAQGAPAPTMKVSGFQVTGNTLLSRQAVDAVLLPMLGQRTLEELQRAAAAVQALYAAEGYGAVVAYVPPQSGQDGLVTIAVVEGKVSTVTVTGASRFTPESIRASLPDLQVGKTPQLRLIDAELRIANENPAKLVQVLLKPGQRLGETEAQVAVTEQELQRFNAGLDNTGNERTGDYRVSLSWQHANLSGHDDVFGAQIQTSPTDPGQVRVISAGYRWPLYRQRMVLEAFAAHSSVDGGSSPTVAGDLQFNGSGRILGMRAGWYLPRLGDFDQRIALGLDRRAYVNRCEIAGLPFGACGPAGASVTVTPISLEYLLQSGGMAPRTISVSLHQNLAIGGGHADAAAFEATRLGAKRAYTALRLSLHGSQPVAEDWTVAARLSGQYTPDALVPGEQFGAGGAASVRGYEEREVTGDSGAAASVELLGPGLLGERLPRGASLRLLSFVDAASLGNHGDAPCAGLRTHCTVAGLGIGARYTQGRLQARLDIAYPLKDAARTLRGDTRAHFAVNLGF